MAEYWEGGETSLSLVEMSLAEQLLTLARNVNETLRDALNTLKDYLEHNYEAVRQRAMKVRGYKNSSERLKEHIVEYLARQGYTLPYYDVYRELVLQLDRIAQNSDAVAYRTSLLASRGKHNLSTAFREKLIDMLNLVNEEYRSLLASIRLLQENPRKSVEEAKKVMSLEDRIDQRYREVEIDIVEELSNNLLHLMLLREVIDLVEDTADVIKEAAENILFLALYRVTR